MNRVDVFYRAGCRQSLRGEAEVDNTSCTIKYRHTIRVSYNVLCSEKNLRGYKENTKIKIFVEKQSIKLIIVVHHIPLVSFFSEDAGIRMQVTI